MKDRKKMIAYLNISISIKFYLKSHSIRGYILTVLTKVLLVILVDLTSSGFARYLYKVKLYLRQYFFSFKVFLGD